MNPPPVDQKIARLSHKSITNTRPRPVPSVRHLSSRSPLSRQMGVFFLNFLRALKGPTKNLVLRTTLFLVYLLFGAAVFQTIESGAEHKEIHHFDKIQQQMKEKYNISDAEMNHLFEEISKAIDDGYFDVGYDRWSFAGSLFFSGTVVTTIGKRNWVMFDLYRKIMHEYTRFCLLKDCICIIFGVIPFVSHTIFIL